MSKYRVNFYDDFGEWIDTEEYVVNSKEEAQELAEDHAENLNYEGWDIEYWNLKKVA